MSATRPGPPVLPGGLQLDEDPEGQRRAWRVERVGWAVMAALIVAALLGLFGSGPLSHTEARSQDGSLRVRYLRFARFGAPVALEVEVSGPLAAQPQGVRLRIGEELLAGLGLRQITPEPAEARAAGGAVLYTFPVEGALDRVTITLDCSRSGDVEVDGGPSVRLALFVYP